MRPAAWIPLLAFAVFACAPASKPVTNKPDSQMTLERVGEAFWAERQRISPMRATYRGDRSRDAELPDVSWEAHQKHLAIVRDLLEQLEKVDRDALDDNARISWDILRYELDTTLETEVCNSLLWEVDQLGGWHVALGELPGYHTITNDKNAADLATRYRASKKLFADLTANLKMGLEKGYVAPRINVERVLDQIDGQLKIPAAGSPYIPSADALPAEWSAEKKAKTQKMLASAVEEGVYPGLTQYRDFLRNSVLPKARTKVGVSEVPDGDACYAALIRAHTGSEESPDALFELGLSEVKRLRGEIEKLIAEDGSDLDVAEYFLDLKQRDDQFFRDRKKLAEYNDALVRRAEAALPRAFGTLPETPIEMKEIEDFRAPDSPAAYYYSAPEDGSRPAYYYINTYKPEERPLYNMAALAFHEAVPGHHLQIALANENKDLPEFQRHIGQTAFVEGWALYAEGLSDELGLYETRYEKLGMYNYELWRAVRLVVDTGMHAKGWSRQKAIEYLSDNTGNPQEEVVNEIDRYITWPGQALAYKWGQLEIRRLRAQAEEKLGAQFDLRAFHDRVLSHGAIPLPTLRRDIEDWVNEQAAARGTD